MMRDEQATAAAKVNTGVLRCAQDDEVSGSRVGNSGGDEGYVLLAVLVLVFLMLLALTIAAPKVAMQIKHDKELETQNRAKQYVRAIRLFHRKTGNFPTSIEQLEKTNNQRYLRQRYLDPLTGKDDWRLIQVGQNKTTVKGFFGKDLPGMPIGLGAASGMQSNMGGASSSGPSGSSFGAGSAFGSSSGFGPQSPSPGGASGVPGSGSGTQSGTGSATPGGGIQSVDATEAKGSTGPIMGVGVPKEGDAFLSVNGVSTYQEWEFLYDPRIESLSATNGALGGAGGGGSSGAFGSGTPGAGAGSNSPTFGPGTPGMGGGGTNGSGVTPPGAPPPPPPVAVPPQ